MVTGKTTQGMSKRAQTPLQLSFYRVIFGTETRAGKWFDIILIMVILASVLVIMLDSIHEYHINYGVLFLQIEWAFTLMFTAEYLIRLWCSDNRKGYAISVYGIVDLLALMPTYLSLLLPQAAPLLIIRVLRILRIFRVLRLLALLDEANDLARALHNSTRKIFVFFSMMILMATIFGCLIYVIEGPEHGFNSIPHSIYWAIVTITTVGYGDVTPHTPLGQFVAVLVMVMGYGIIAIPTGIVTAEMTVTAHRDRRNCTNCREAGHAPNAMFCRACGKELAEIE